MDNLHVAEVEKFDQVGEEWWNPEGPLRTLHDINPTRLQFIISALNGVSLRGKTVLDIGCGGGILSESLAQLGAEVTGIDASEKAIQAAISHAQQDRAHHNHHPIKIHYLKSTAEQFLPSELFDMVVCMELLEHVPSPQSLVSACSRMVKPQGRVFFSTLNRNLKSFLFAIVGAEYVLGIVPKGTHDYAKFIKPSELQKMARQAELSFIKIKGMTYHPFSRRSALTDQVGVNYLVCCQKEIS